MNALLIHPRFPDTFWSLRHALRFVGKQAVMPPLGLLTVAALLPTSWTLRLVDTNVRDLSPEDLRWADIAMVGAMGVQRVSAVEIIDRCRQAGLRTVAGGPLFTSEPEAFTQVDHLVLNEAELTLPPFLADLAAGTPRRIYATTAFADLRRSPVPRWDLLDLRRYHSMGVQFSRGCPFNCDFCNVTALFGRTPRTKSGPQVVSELEALRRTGWHAGVFFVDDNLIGNKSAAKTDLLPAIIDWRAAHPRSGITFNTQASINLADDPKALSMLGRAGFDTVFVGIETPDNDSLAECGKTQNRRRNMVEDVKTIQRAGIEVQGGFIVGFDSDLPSIFRRQIDFIQSSGIATAMVGLLNAMPGTALYDRLRAANRLRGSSTGDNVDGSTNIVPLMDERTLDAGYHHILASIYAPAAYYRRARTFLRTFTPPDIKSRIDMSRVRAFLRSLIWLGVLHHGRLRYWQFLAWTLLRRPRLLGRAITLAITGHHFRRVCMASST
jgi:radical SAM superfamily enzyme YgiQ (UPF0313 family)